MASIGFRWLEILEKEFDKAFVDLDLTIGELESEEPNVVYSVRQKLCTISSCFAQLAHKSQTIFQNSAKLEAELIHMRAELTESKSKREVLENELHHLLLQLHSSQLSKLPDTLGSKRQENHFKPDISAIKQRFDDAIRESPMRKVSTRDLDELKFSSSSIEPAKYKADVVQLRSENAALRNEVLSLTSDVYGAKLAAKYLDKELAGRIQQLQLLGREMRGDVRDKLWRQLESEILLQRHKTVVRACRRNCSLNNSSKCSKPEPETVTESTEHFGDIRTVVVKRKPDQGLGISITGGREHGVPILISELEHNGPAALSEQLYIGDAILNVNEIDLRSACHREAVNILQQQTGDCKFQVRYIAADDSDNSLEEDGFHFKFFDEEVCDQNNPKRNDRTEEVLNTPTAPRTPDSFTDSRVSAHSPRKTNKPVILDTENNGNCDEYEKIEKERFSNNNKSPETAKETLTTDLVLIDNATNNVIKLENFKKVDVFSTMEDNYNTSSNSLNSDNLSSPMQTSTDVYVDSEILSATDLASNDSRSPKNGQSRPKKPEFYRSDESLSDAKSLLDSGDSSPSRQHKKQKKHRKKYFGVKTLQSIFNKRDGYSDVSTTASEPDEPPIARHYPETSPQFEQNVHNLLSDMFAKSRPPSSDRGGKKYFSLHGQNLRVGKALRLCPNDDADTEERREKLLARYVYNANSLRADGVGDPDFGTPV